MKNLFPIRSIIFSIFVFVSMSLDWMNAMPAIAESKNKTIHILETKDSIEAFLHAVALNGDPVEPTDFPQAAVGDIVTFRLAIQNRLFTPIYDVNSRIKWGDGLSYEGNLAGKHVELRYDGIANELSAAVPEIPPKNNKADADYSCLFDLRVTSCQGLTVDLHFDESRTREPVKTYPLALRMKNPKLELRISPENIIIDSEKTRTIEVEIENAGDGKAVGFILDTSFENLPLKVSAFPPSFSYDATTGEFRSVDPILPGRTLAFKFDVQATEKNARALPPAPISFKPFYANECGIIFNAPEKLALPSTANTGTNGKSEMAWDSRLQSGVLLADASKMPPETGVAAGEKRTYKKRTIPKEDSLKQFGSSDETVVFADSSDLVFMATPEAFRVESPEKPLTWSIYVVNRGSGPAYKVQLTNRLGRNLRFDNSKIDDLTADPILESDSSAPGVTAVVWELGDMGPSENRKVTITAFPVEKENWQPDGFGNTVGIISEFGSFWSLYPDVNEPRFVLPDESIDGDEVFGGCGKLHVFFSVTQLYKSNLYRTNKDPEGVWALFLTPGVWFANPGSCDRIVEVVTSSATPGGLVVNPFYPATDRKYQSYLLYTPQMEIYYGRSDENMITHRADAYFRYNTQNKFSFRVLDQYKRSHDSISSRVFTIDDRYQSNLLNLLGTYDPTAKLRFRLDYSNYYLNYDSSENSRADRMDNSWAGYGFFHLTPKLSIFANYEFSDIDYDSNELDSEENRYFAGFRWEITRKTQGQVKGGYGKKSYDLSGLSDAETWMAEIQVDHHLTSRTHVVFNAFRRYDESLGEIVKKDDVVQNYTTRILTHCAAVSLNYDMTRKLHLNLDAMLFYDEYEDERRLSSGKERNDTEFNISPSVKFDFSKWLTFDLAYIYANRNSNYSQFDFEDHTVFLRGSIYQ